MARDIRQSKTCTACGLEFFKKPHQKWIRWRCDSCAAIYDKNRRKARGPSYRMWAGAKHRAKINNLDFNLDVSDIIVPEYCPVFGIKLDHYLPEQADNSPSLDRIDNDRGYIKGNVQVISLKANRVKSNATVQELEALVNYLKQF